MSFVVVDHVPASAVATAGTFAPSYPAGKSAGSFAAYGHRLFAEGLQYEASVDAGDFSISFGATTFTVTWNGSTSLPANKNIKIQLNEAGTDDKQLADISHMKRMSLAPPVYVDLGAPKAIDDNGIAESQSVAAAAAFVLNGVQSDLYGGANVKLDVPRAVTAAWTTTSVLTITGKDEYGDIIVEQSASGASHTGKKAFAEITSITSSASITSAIVGWGDVLGLPVYVDKVGRILAEYKDGVVLSATGGRTTALQGIQTEANIDAGTSLFMVAPVAGVISKVTTIAQGTITTGGTITVEVNTVAVDGLAVVVADGAVAGDVDSDTPTRDHASTVVAVGDNVEIVFPAAFNASADMVIIVEIETTYATHGTFVAGVQTKPTATTGDTKGTYDPATAATGAISFGLLLALPDPTYKGVDNYDG